jgi:hypothetical protein
MELDHNLAERHGNGEAVDGTYSDSVTGGHAIPRLLGARVR